MNTKIYFAHTDTRNFRFEAMCTSAAGALKLLKKAIKMHEVQCKLEDCDQMPQHSMERWWFEDDFVVEERSLGVPYRNGSEIK
jgi:hypothetical protein